MAAFSTTQSGPWDDVNTWGGGGFPGATDTWTINNTHVVTVQGTELGSTGTINAGGVLELDGQSNTVPAILQIQPNVTILNNGIIREIGTGSTGYASIESQTPASPYVNISNNAPVWSDGYWKLGKLFIGGGGLVTEELGCTIVLTQSDFWVEGDFIIRLNDTFDAADADLHIEAFSTFFKCYVFGTFIKGTSHTYFERDGASPANTDLFMFGDNQFYDVTVQASQIVTTPHRVLVQGSLIGSITLSGTSDKLLSMNDLTVTGTLNAANAEIALVVKDKAEVVRRIRNE